MTIKELKNKLLNNEYNDKFIIFTYKYYDIIPLEYISKISTILNTEETYTDNLNDCLSYDTLFFEISNGNKLYVLRTESFDLKDYKLKDDFVSSIDKNSYIVIVCKKVVNESLKKYVVNFPEVLDWQIEDYMRVRCKGVNQKKLQWLQKISNNNLYRIYNELNRLSIEDEDYQDEFFDNLSSDGCYDDLTDLNVFSLIDGILSNDKKKVKSVLEELSYIDVTSYGLVTLLYNDIMIMIAILSSSKNTAESLGIKPFRFSKIKSYLDKGNYSGTKLKDMFKVLASFDSNIKLGNISLSEHDTVIYIIVSMMSIINRK